jgi:hypothetical protein
LLFSLFGYRLLISSLVKKADKELEARLDDNSYDESQLILFKVPITKFSYYNPSDRWERIEGSIEVGNVYYKYVKRRILEDSLEVLCIPNSRAMELQAVKRQASHPLSFKILSPEPYVSTVVCSVAPSPCRSLPRAFYYLIFIPSHPRYTEERPPSLA